MAHEVGKNFGITKYHFKLKSIMKQKCRFDSKKDFKKTAPNLSIDLARALADHVVPSTGVEVEHNGIESSSDVGDVVRDPFQAIQAQREITRIGKVAMQEHKAAQAKAEAEKAAAQAAAQAKATADVNPE